jgi:hypothetical protein
VVTECIGNSVVPFDLEVTMTGGEPSAVEANDDDSAAIDEKHSRLFVTSVPGVAFDLDRQYRLGHTPHILLLMDEDCSNSDVGWPR